MTLIPYELYVLVDMVALLAVAAWECAKGWNAVRISRLWTLANRTGESIATTRLSREELQDPGELSLHDAGRLMELRTRFGTERVGRRHRQNVPQPPVEPQPRREVLPILPQLPQGPSSSTASMAAAATSSMGEELPERHRQRPQAFLRLWPHPQPQCFGPWSVLAKLGCRRKSQFST